MTESYENWGKGIDWSRRTSVVITAAQAGQAQRIERSEKAPRVPSGPAFYDFVKAKAIPVLEDGLHQLEATKSNCEDRMRRRGGIAER